MEQEGAGAALLARQVARAAAGDRTAYAALVRQFQRPLFAFLGRMGLRQAEAEELAQDTFIRAWQHLPRYDAGQAAFSTWLFTIARRLALNALDRADHQRLRTGLDAAADEEHACDAPGPAQALQSRQERARLQAALRRLSPDDRSVLALAYVHELTLADVARIEGCSPTAAKARLHRARERLRAALSEPGVLTVPFLE
ncbi:RNA polymerase sigma factor [Azohydromonas caseinilytica]|uniref:RNA polymerase sigma factor n=1 Tax=Azohydromonas caseinilytica TaxID=2728836 RepID=A0A848F6B1_9BURK|nr:sigma-70 family RNA polymerase sigma factor [Azohydromonas caseinilytica]NML15114.1 sigma-70 family RNA polymerase sigma factor [Azohydromonas caseinilytica]